MLHKNLFFLIKKRSFWNICVSKRAQDDELPSKKRTTAGSNPTSYPKKAFGIYGYFNKKSGSKNPESLDALTPKSVPKTKSQPSEAVVILKGGAAAWAHSDFCKKVVASDIKLAPTWCRWWDSTFAAAKAASGWNVPPARFQAPSGSSPFGQ